MDDFAGGVGAAWAGEAVAGMSAGATEKKPADGSLVARPIEDGSHGETLSESTPAVENVAGSETVGGFEILGRYDLDAFDQAWEIRSVRGECSNDSGAKFPAAGVPISFLQFIGSILNAGRENMFAFRSQCPIENGGNGDIKIRSFREIAVLGSVESALEVVDFGADLDAASESFEKALGSIERQESRKTAETEIHVGDRAVRTKVLDAG